MIELNEKRAGVYVHIPFCVAKCAYCDFVSGVYNDDIMHNYVDALIKEIKSRAVGKAKYSILNNYNNNVGSSHNSCSNSDDNEYDKKLIDENIKIDSIYFGGGTPSMLYNGAIKDIINAVKENFNLCIDSEITVECNPESVTCDKVNELKNAGVTRISIGMQVVQDNLLKLINRQHTIEQFKYAYELIKRSFNNINIDIMYGLPMQSVDNVKESVEFCVANKPTHISAYALCLHKGTDIYKLIKSNQLSLPLEDIVADSYNCIVDRLVGCGYIRYETSNFCLPTYKSRHNSKYWDIGVDYYGFGVSAASKIGNKRIKNTNSIEQYIKFSTKSNIAKTEILTTEEQKIEYIMLSLRTIEGINVDKYCDRFGVDFFKEHTNASDLIKKGYLLKNQDSIVVARDKWLVADSIIRQLI